MSCIVLFVTVRFPPQSKIKLLFGRRKLQMRFTRAHRTLQHICTPTTQPNYSSLTPTKPLKCPNVTGTKLSFHCISLSVVCPVVLILNLRNICATVRWSVALARFMPMQLRLPREKLTMDLSRRRYVSGSQSQRSGSNVKGEGKMVGLVFCM
jgi:hypothetical protein